LIVSYDFPLKSVLLFKYTIKCYKSQPLPDLKHNRNLPMIKFAASVIPNSFATLSVAHTKLNRRLKYFGEKEKVDINLL
jgi:hypothetical protein